MAKQLVSDELWAAMAPLLPVRVNTHRLKGDVRGSRDRIGVAGIFSCCKTGCLWEVLDEKEDSSAWRRGMTAGAACRTGKRQAVWQRLQHLLLKPAWRSLTSCRASISGTVAALDRPAMT